MELVTADRVVTGRPGEVLEEAGVLFEGNRIEWVGRLAELTADRRAGASRAHYAGATILPGLIDSHVHLGFDGGPDPVQRMKGETDAEQLVLMLFSARELLGAGVTSARDLGARSFLDVTVKRAIADGLAEGPRLLTAARPITVTGGHCWFMGGEADGLDAIRHQVRLHHKMGADLIKVMATGGHMTKGSVPWHAQFDEGEMRALVSEAHRLEKKVAAHAHGTEGIRNAAAARVDTIEHCSWAAGSDASEYDPATADRIAEAGIHVCPTFNWRAQRMPGRWEGRAQRLDAMHEAGVRIVAGTDSGINLTPHRQYVGGLEALEAAGMPALEVLEAAT
ncbi:MAG: amidohydrolase family protein, partial [Candidatus Dormibacteraceae bacterium]